jgi:hypothetical protein
MIDPKALETLFRYTIGDFKRNKEAEEAMTYGRSKELIGDNVTELGKVETKLTDDQKRFIGQEEKKPNIESIRVNLVEDPEKKTGIASLNTDTQNVVEKQTSQKDFNINDIINLDLQNPSALGQFKNYFKDKNISNDYILNQLQILGQDIGELESNNQPTRKYVNPNTNKIGARGKYQFKVDDMLYPGDTYPKGHQKAGQKVKEYQGSSFETALNRTERFYKRAGKDIPKWLQKARTSLGPDGFPEPSKIPEKFQDIMFFADILERPNSSKLIKKYLENPNNIDVFQDVYNVWHTEGGGPNMKKSIMERLPKYNLKKQEKQSGGMIEKNPYKRQPRFI